MKSYHQFCGVAKALDVLGGRWTLLLIRDLLPGPRRFSDLLASHPGLTTNLLAERLKLLATHGLVEKRKLPPPAASTVYALTPDGEALEDLVLALGRFGQRYLTAPGDDRVDVRWFAVSLRRSFRGSGPPFRVQLFHGEVPIHVFFDGERLHTSDGVAPAEVTLRSEHVPAVLMGLAPLHAARITGDLTVLERLQHGLRPDAISPDGPGATGSPAP